MSTTPAAGSEATPAHCAEWYMNDTQDATSAELLTIEYICQMIPVDIPASDTSSTSNNDEDAQPAKQIRLLSEQSRPVLQMSPQHRLFDQLTHRIDNSGRSSVPGDVVLPEWQYSPVYFREMIQTVRGDEQLQREARVWWERVSRIPSNAWLRSCGDACHGDET